MLLLAAGLCALVAAASATGQPSVIDFIPEDGPLTFNWHTDASWDGGFKPCPGDTAFLATRTEDALTQPYTVEITDASATVAQIVFSPGTFISFGVPSPGQNFLGINLIRPLDEECFNSRTTTSTTTTTTTTTMTTTKSSGSGGSTGDKKEDNSLIIIIMAVVIALLLCIVIAVLLFRRHSEAANNESSARKGVQSFENPMYEEHPADGDVDADLYGGADDVPATTGYSDVNARQGDGYLDVAAHDEDTYNDPTLAVRDNDGMDGFGDSAYDVVNPSAPGEVSGYSDVGGEENYDTVDFNDMLEDL